MKCKDCIWWFPLQEVHDSTEFKNCLALDYPTCIETFTRADADCIVPHLAQPRLRIIPCDSST